MLVDLGNIWVDPLKVVSVLQLPDRTALWVETGSGLFPEKPAEECARIINEALQIERGINVSEIGE